MSKGKSQRKKKAPLQSLEPQNAAKVKGGVAFSPLIASRIAAHQTGGSTEGGKNDPAQMFQQIMQQLTHG